jgi:hypothetical protein
VRGTDRAAIFFAADILEAELAALRALDGVRDERHNFSK